MTLAKYIDSTHSWMCIFCFYHWWLNRMKGKISLLRLKPTDTNSPYTRIFAILLLHFSAFYCYIFPPVMQSCLWHYLWIRNIMHFLGYITKINFMIRSEITFLLHFLCRDKIARKCHELSSKYLEKVIYQYK